MEVESEVKYRLLGPEDHRKLVAGLAGSLGSERQENFYLDTADLFLAGSMVMLRLRRSPDGAARLTLKSGTSVEAGFFRSEEIESGLSPELAASVLADPASLQRLDLAPAAALRERFGERPLSVVGSLSNERARFRTAGFVVEVDRMSFPDGSEEYEVEIETERPEEARAWLAAELHRLGARAEPSLSTKYARLLSWLSLHRV